MQPKTTTSWVIQQDYRYNRSGEPEAWAWHDTGYGAFLDKELAERRFDILIAEARGRTNRFVRGYRLVKRVTITEDEIVETRELETSQ